MNLVSFSGPAGLRYARGNLLIGPGGEAAALYRLRATSYPLLGLGAKWALQKRLERLAHAVGSDFSLWRVTRAYPADRYADELAGKVDERGQDPERWRAFLAGHQDRLARQAAHVPHIFLAVSLTDRREQQGLARSAMAGLDAAKARALSLLRPSAPGAIAGQRLTALALSEQRLLDRLSMIVSLRRARTKELEWLLRRAPLRGTGEPVLERYWQPDALIVDADDGQVAYEPLESDLWRLSAAPMREDPAEPPSLHVETDGDPSFQAFLCLGALAEEPVFPGAMAELLYTPLDALGFPVDAAVHARWLGNREALGQVRKRIVDVEQVYRDQLTAAAGPGWRAEDDRTLAREYEATLQGGARPPMLYASLSLAVGASSREELERRVSALREQYGDVQLHRPRGLQERLFFDHLPRPDGGTVGDYQQQVTVEQFGALVPTATAEVGDPGGIYVGWTPAGGGRPVRYDVTAPSREDRASAVLLAGTLGSGKSVAAQLIAYGGERRGSLIIDFDPKPDHGWQRIPELDGRVEVVELTGAEEQRGKLDPLAIGLEDLREELAASYLLDLLRDPPASWEQAIQRAVRDVVREGGRSCLQVIRRLRQLDTSSAAEAADALDVIADFGLARLGFGDGSADLVTAARPVTTIRAPGLTLPEPGVARETYTRAERTSVATLSLVAAWALRLVTADRSRHKVVLLDEAAFLSASSQGRSIISRVVLMGRGYNATVLLAAQRLAGIGDISELVGSFFIFGQDSDKEATRALELIGVQPTADRVARLREAHPGRCVMRDLTGRTAWVQIDPADPDLLAALDTTPPTQPETGATA